MEWIDINERLPETGQLCWIKRDYKGYQNLYIGHRLSGDLSTNPDPSKNTLWYGNPVDEMDKCMDYNLHFIANFSDVTVVGWQPILPPPPTKNP